MYTQAYSPFILLSFLSSSVLGAANQPRDFAAFEQDFGRWQSYASRWRWPTPQQHAPTTVTTTTTTTTPAPTSVTVQATTVAAAEASSSDDTVAPTTLITSTVAAADPSTSTTAQTTQPSIPDPTGLSLTTPWLPDYETDDIPDVTDQNFIDVIMVNVNNMRKAHDAEPLEWSADAANYAVAMEAKYPCEHTGSADRNGYGENLCMNTGPQWIKTTGDSMQAWYDEWPNYNPSNESTYMAWGHYTQLVWKDTTHIGCAWSKTPDCTAGSDWHTIRCLFSPAGNVAGMYTQEVSM